MDLASANYAAALAGSPGNGVVAARAYREALTAGDMALARASAGVMTVAGVAPADTAVLAVADAVRARDWVRAGSAVDRLAGGPLEFLAPAIRAWIAFDRGDADGAAGGGQSANAVARRFTAENAALLLIARGDRTAGIAALQTLLGADGGNADLRINAAQLLANGGDGDGARALLAGNDPILSAVRDSLGNGRKPSAAFGVSRLFVRLAGEIVDSDARPLAIVLGRGAVELDPAYGRARLVLADALSRDGAASRALAVLERVDRTGPYHIPARTAEVTILARSGDTKRALATASEISEAPGASSADAQRVGDLLIAAGRFAEGADAYATAIARAGPRPGWILYLQRGGALEQAGQWEAARDMLRRAVELAPDQPVALNYLGYAQLERGENLPVARALLERASKLSPDDSSITDSLGWAYFRTGDTARALPLLERAARERPDDVTIQEHLGDIYWDIGRRFEARYAWRAASIAADGKDAERLAGKLASGPAR